MARAVTGYTYQISVGVLVGYFYIGKGKQAMGVCNIEHIAAFSGKAAAAYREGGGSYIGVAAHRLVDHDVVDVFVGAGGFCITHVSCNRAVLKGYGVLSLYDQCFGIVGGELSVIYGDFGRRINCRGIIAV